MDINAQDMITILLVEDDVDFSTALTARLTKRGFAVDPAFNGEDGLRKFGERKYDAIICDIKLPGMDGIHFTASVREKDKDIPIILLTGYASLETAKEAVTLDATDYLLKPLESLEDLLNPVQKAVRAHRLMAENAYLTEQLKDKVKELEISEQKYRDLFEWASDGILIIDPNGVIVSVNKQIEAVTQYTADSLQGQPASILFTAPSSEEFRAKLREVVDGKPLDTVEVKVSPREGRVRLMELGLRPIRKDGYVFGVQCIARDITERKQVERMLRASETKLLEQTALLEKKNTVLREVLEHIEIEKKRLKEDITINIEEFIYPALRKIKQMATPAAGKQVDLVMKNLENLSNNFGHRMAAKVNRLTRREIQICNMIRCGLTTREIADLCETTPPTIDKHRSNIRKKLGLLNQSDNLTACLQSLTFTT
ncbi:MAG TPA: PAS domain S-box protein [Elusimicrobiota bacterium]|nr:PAS domain S-box protein [Elusimicrobiota bacterium]